MIAEAELHVVEDELDVTPWAEQGVREIEEYLALHAEFDEWLAEHGRV